MARPLQYPRMAALPRPRSLEALIGKYLIAWLLGVPLSVLVLIYLVSNAACV